MKRCLSQNTVSRHQWYERNGAMLLWIVYFKFLLKTDRVCYGAVPFEPTCQTGSSLWPRYIISFLSFEGLFVQSVFKSHLLPSLVPPSFPRPQSDNYPQQNFFSHILHNSRLSLSRNLSSKYSIVPTVFQLSHKYGKAALNSNNDKLGNILKLCH